MKLTTMCYVRGPQGVLMLHRTKKEVDINQGKWIGVGGKMESGESPEECVIREVYEETGLTISAPKLAALITFNFLDPDPTLSDWDTEYMFVFVADEFEGKIRPDCPEGDLCWFPEDFLLNLNLWEGDMLFMVPVLNGAPFFSMKLVYRGDTLESWKLED